MHKNLTCLICTGGSSNIYNRFFGVKRSHYFTCVAESCRRVGPGVIRVEVLLNSWCHVHQNMFLHTRNEIVRTFDRGSIWATLEACSASLAPTRYHLVPTSFLYAAFSFLRPEGIEVSSHSFQLLAWDIPPRCFEENLKGDTFFSDVAYCFGSLWMPDPFQRLRDRESATGKERGGCAPPTRIKTAL